MQGVSLAVNALLSSAPRTLRKLSLEVDDGTAGIRPTISRLSNLVSLSVTFCFFGEVFREDLDCISALSNLQELRIDKKAVNNPGFVSVNCPWLTDQYFRSWIAKLRQLRILRLALSGFPSASITQACLQSLSDSCPLLADCQLMWEHDLNAWTSLEAPLFPNLEVFHLGQVKDHGHNQGKAAIDKVATRDVKVIQNLAPSLRRFFIESVRPHEKALMTIFKAGF